VVRQRKVLDLEVGKLFGEDHVCFGLPNTYSVRAESPVVTLLVIRAVHFQKKYKRMLGPLQRYFGKRQALIAATVAGL